MELKKNIVVFGTGERYLFYKEKLGKYNIVAFIDNDVEKQNVQFDNRYVYAPCAITSLEFDYVYLMSNEWFQMKEQLKQLQVREEKIRNYIQLEQEYDFQLFPSLWMSKECLFPPDILLVSYSLGQTGAPMALLTAAKVLKSCGYKPIIVSNEDGILREEALCAGIPVSIDEKIEDDYRRLELWAKMVDYIIVNTIMYGRVLEEYHLDKPIIWWLHDAKQYYSKLLDEVGKEHVLPQKVKPYAVGEIAARNFEEVYKTKASNLFYGIEKYNAYRESKSEKVIFAIIGNIVDRKGQDILFKAIDNLPQSINQKIELWVIGAGDINFLSELSSEEIERVFATQNILFFGEVPFEEVKRMYSKIDILICPSREDPMPIAVTEAIMLNIPVIVSDGCGTAPIVEANNLGIVVKSGEVSALTNAISYACENRDFLKNNLKNGEKVFEEYFSLDAFKNNIVTILHENY